MLHNTQGIVLRAMPYSETSLIVRIYTRDFGLQSFMVKGARSSRSGSRAALLRPPNVLEMVIYHREGRNLQNIKELSLFRDRIIQPFHPGRSTVMLFMVELLNRVLLEEDANEGLFEYLLGSLFALDRTTEGIACFPHLFMCGLSRHLGFAPDIDGYKTDLYFDIAAGRFNAANNCGPLRLESEESQALIRMLGLTYEQLPNLQLSAGVRKTLLYGLLDYYKLHVGHMGKMNAPAILESVLRG